MDWETQLEGYKAAAQQPHVPVVDRYYTKRYRTDVNNVIGQDFCVLEHSNRICLITLAPSHPVLSKGLKVLNVNFQADEKNDRLDNKVSGKFKRGAQMIKERSPLCHLTCDDDNVYTVYGCMRGSLVEVNENLIENAQLINEEPQGEGYIAILLARQNDHAREMSHLLTEEQYAEVLQKRLDKPTSGESFQNLEETYQNTSAEQSTESERTCKNTDAEQSMEPENASAGTGVEAHQKEILEIPRSEQTVQQEISQSASIEQSSISEHCIDKKRSRLEDHVNS